MTTNIKAVVLRSFVGTISTGRPVQSTLAPPVPPPAKSLRRQMLKVCLSFGLLFYAIASLHGMQVEQNQADSWTQLPETAAQVGPGFSRTTVQTRPGFPTRLKIPRINVDATIEYVNLTAQGAMAAPDNAINVGWFALGPRPGEIGSAVIDGHFDGQQGEAGVFSNLYQLQAGDKLYVEDTTGASLVFVVRETRLYDPGYAETVFGQNFTAHLNLITCDGVWDGSKKSYSKRLVVFADIEQQ